MLIFQGKFLGKKSGGFSICRLDKLAEANQSEHSAALNGIAEYRQTAQQPS
jgi:exonuclease I